MTDRRRPGASLLVPGSLTPFDEQCRPEENDEDDTFANFSNYGRPIDLIAPGVCMTMPWVPNGGELHQQSGTSFAADDRPAGVTFELQRRIADGSWTALPLGGGTTIVTKVPFDSVVTFRVRATDGAGNRSDWLESPALVGRLFDSASKEFSYAGTWTIVAAADTFGGSIARARDPGSSATLTTSGRAVAVVVTRGPSRGRGRLQLDGEIVATFETLAGALATRRIVASTAWASDEPRPVSVWPMGTSGRPRIDFDALLMLQRAP